jgi:hypothetical protein
MMFPSEFPGFVCTSLGRCKWINLESWANCRFDQHKPSLSFDYIIVFGSTFDVYIYIVFCHTSVCFLPYKPTNRVSPWTDVEHHPKSLCLPSFSVLSSPWLHKLLFIHVSLHPLSASNALHIDIWFLFGPLWFCFFVFCTPDFHLTFLLQWLGWLAFPPHAWWSHFLDIR